MYSFVGFGVGLLLRRLGERERDRDLDFERNLDEDELEADLCLLRRTGLGDLDTDLEADLLGAFTGGFGGDFDLTLGCSGGGSALVLISFGSFVTSFPSTLTSFFVSFFTLVLSNKNSIMIKHESAMLYTR